MFSARSLAITSISHESVSVSVQSTCSPDVCVHTNHVTEAVVHDHSTTSEALIPTSSVTLMVVVVISTLLVLTGAVIVSTGATVSIIYDCVLLHSAPLLASSAKTVIVHESDIPLTVHVTGFAYGSVVSHPAPIHVHNKADVHHDHILIFVRSPNDGVETSNVVSLITVLLIVVGAVIVITGGK